MNKKNEKRKQQELSLSSHNERTTTLSSQEGRVFDPFEIDGMKLASINGLVDLDEKIAFSHDLFCKWQQYGKKYTAKPETEQWAIKKGMARNLTIDGFNKEHMVQERALLPEEEKALTFFPHLAVKNRKEYRQREELLPDFSHDGNTNPAREDVYLYQQAVNHGWSGIDPWKQVEARKTLEQVFAEVNLTDTEKSELLWLLYLTEICGMTQKEAAEWMGIDYDLARKHLQRYTKRLKNQFPELVTYGKK